MLLGDGRKGIPDEAHQGKCSIQQQRRNEGLAKVKDIKLRGKKTYKSPSEISCLSRNLFNREIVTFSPLFATFFISTASNAMIDPSAPPPEAESRLENPMASWNATLNTFLA